MATLIISISPVSPPNTFTYKNNTNSTYERAKKHNGYNGKRMNCALTTDKHLKPEEVRPIKKQHPNYKNYFGRTCSHVFTRAHFLVKKPAVCNCTKTVNPSKLSFEI